MRSLLSFYNQFEFFLFTVMLARSFRRLCLLLIGALTIWSLWMTPAWAGLNDDNYDGNIFALYAGNGSIVPPRFSLAQSLEQVG